MISGEDFGRGRVLGERRKGQTYKESQDQGSRGILRVERLGSSL